MQAAFWVLTSDDMAVSGVAEWLCEQGMQRSGLSYSYVLISYQLYGTVTNT
jgi:hypothetical protein